MKIKILKDKSYKFGLHLAKGEVRDAIWSEDANAYQVKSSENVILNVSKKDAKVILSIDEAIHKWGKRYFRSYEWDETTGFTAIGKTGTTHMYDAEYIINKFKNK
jgi:hypothetical protein